MNNKIFTCKYCGKNYNDKGNLALHEDVCIKNVNANHYESSCKYCGKIFTKGTKANIFAATKAHEISCSKNPNHINYTCKKCGLTCKTKNGLLQHSLKCIGPKKKNEHTTCIFCGKEILNVGSLIFHENYCKLNPNKKTYLPHIKKSIKGHPAWNKGLTKKTDKRIQLFSEKAKEKNKRLKEKGKAIGIASTPEKEQERRKKISETMKKNQNSGGKRQGSGKGKKGWYKGYFCDSSWELAFVIYNIDHNISFNRNYQGFEYEYKGEKHKFYPDFIMSDKTYVEIKGAMTEQNKIKIETFKDKLYVIGKKEISIYLNYVIKKYGKNFIDLYEKK